MIVESVFCIIGICFTIPAVISESYTFTITEFSTWVRFLPQSLLVLALSMQFFKKIYIPSLISAGLSLLGTYFLLMFNSQSSSISICAKFSSICTENSSITYNGDILSIWQGILYLLGLCFKIIGTSLLIRNLAKKLKPVKVSPKEIIPNL